MNHKWWPEKWLRSLPNFAADQMPEHELPILINFEISVCHVTSFLRNLKKVICQLTLQVKSSSMVLPRAKNVMIDANSNFPSIIHIPHEGTQCISKSDFRLFLVSRKLISVPKVFKISKFLDSKKLSLKVHVNIFQTYEIL